MCLELGIYIKHEIAGKCAETMAERLNDLDLLSVEGRLLIADAIKCWEIFHSKCGICPKGIYVLARSGITLGHHFKIAHGFFSMDCRGLFSLRFLSTWNSLPDDVVAIEILVSFKSAICCCLHTFFFPSYSGSFFKIFGLNIYSFNLLFIV